MRPLLAALALTATAASAAPPDPLPPGHGRPLPVDVHAGTSYAVAVSPDGKTLAFDLQGTLWLLPASGGTARRITSWYADAHHPVWAPDGKHLAWYAYGDNGYDLWTANADGSHASRITTDDFDDREPAWSPDGKRLAFASDRGGSYALWTIDLATRRLIRLTGGAREDRAPAWSPDGRTIAFAAGGAIYTVPASGGEATAIAIPPPGTRYDSPALGADGQQTWIASDASGSHLLVDGKPVSADENVFPFPASRPAGQGAWYYVSDGLIRRREGAEVQTVPFTARLAVTRPDYPRARRDFGSTAPRCVLGIQHPVLSPDGREIAFVALGDLWRVASTGGKPEPLTRDHALEADPAWSPDGRQLAYTSDKTGGLPQLWLRDLATGKDRQLTTGETQPLAATWSPDGRRIAYLDTDGLWGNAALKVLDLPTGQQTRLSQSLPQPGKPAWSADGRWIALALNRPASPSFREGHVALRLFAADGKAEPQWRDPADLPGLDTTGGGGPAWSPDGRHLAAIQDGLLKIWPVSPDATPLGPARTLGTAVAHYPSWSADSRTILVQSADSLQLVDATTGYYRPVPLDFTYTPDVPKTRLVIHVGGLVDAVTEQTRHDQDIIVTGNRIAAILPHDERNRAGADQYIDAPGLTAIPGLIDHHTHPQKDFGANLHRAWLAYGVTTVRDPGNQPYDGVEDREAAEAGVRIGPRIFTTGPLLEWRRSWYRMAVAVAGPAHLERELARARALRYDLIKSYVRMPDLRQRRIVAAAHAMGVPVATHEIFPAAYTGADATEHLGASSRRGFSPKQGPQGRAYEDVIQLMGQSRRTLTPTNFGVLVDVLNAHPEYRADPRLALYPAWARASIEHATSLPPPIRAVLPGQAAAIKAFHDAGAVIAAGTDTMLAPSLPAELASYVDAGLTPFEALQTATANPARALNLDAGTLEPGKLADFVLIDGDPLKDITTLFRTRQVIANGRPWTVEQLLETARPRPIDPTAKP